MLRLLVPIVGLLAVLVILTATNLPLKNFDGNLFEPGCDWGNPHCEREDYRDMCTKHISITDGEYVRWCKGRHW